MEKTFDIAIAGAGAVGLATAVAIARFAGGTLRIAIGDAALSAPPTQGRVAALAPGSQAMLEALGVWTAIAPAAQPVLRMEIGDSRAADAVRLPILSFAPGTDEGPIAWLVPQAAIESTLREAAGALGVTLLATPIRDFETRPGRTVVRGPGGAFAARLLIAADGRRSRLRALADIATIGWSYAASGIVATIGHTRDHEGLARQHFLPAGPFAVLPLIGRRSSIVWTEPTRRAEEIAALDPPAFLEELALRFGHEVGALELLDRPAAYPLALQAARAFVAPRLALVGDAAHVIHPIAGQGLNLGLRGAATLAEEIVEQARLGLDPGAPEPLENYQRRCRFDAYSTGLALDALNRLFANDSTPLRLARDLGLGLVERSPTLKRALMREAAGFSGDPPLLIQGRAI